MQRLAAEIGQRIRSYRLAMHMSQEELAEKCGLHPTYIGQLERGEKNVTVESLAKVARGLSVPVCRLVENIDENETPTDYPMQAYKIFLSENEISQKRLIGILKKIIEYGHNR